MAKMITNKTTKQVNLMLPCCNTYKVRQKTNSQGVLCCIRDRQLYHAIHAAQDALWVCRFQQFCHPPNLA